MICFRSAGLGSRLRCGFERSPKRRSQCRPRQEYSRPRSSLVSYPPGNCKIWSGKAKPRGPNGAEPNAALRCWGDGETGDFKCPTLVKLKPRPFRKPGLFFESNESSLRARHDFLPKTEPLASPGG